MPQRDPDALFELLLLEGFQAGLSWITVLKKRERYREVLFGFDVQRVAQMSDAEIDELMLDPGIIRNRAKLNAARQNAQAWLELDDPAGFLWSFVGGQPKINPFRRSRRGAGDYPGSRGHEQGAAQGRLQLRRADHLLRLHAGQRHGHGPYPGLRPLRPTRRLAGRSLTDAFGCSTWNIGAQHSWSPRFLAAALAFFPAYNARSSRARSVSWRNSKVPWWWGPTPVRVIALACRARRRGRHRLADVEIAESIPRGSADQPVQCFPELSETELEKLVGQSLMDIGRTLTESACAWIWPPEKSLRYIREVEGMEVLEEALASGDGLVGITSHLGNWEVLNHFYCSYAKPIIFYRPPKLKAVDELLKKQRVQLGNRVAPSTPEGILSVIKEVKKGGCVGIPADPEPARTAGLFVPYLGTTALISKFVPQLLSRGKARGVFFHAVRPPDGSGYKVILEAAPADMYDKDLEVSVAAMSRELAKYVRAYPSQYMWSMKRFKNRPDGEKKWY